MECVPMGCMYCKPNDKAKLSSYYEETCPLDPKLNSFSIALRQHTTSAISSVAQDAAINRSLSCRSLKRATDGIRAVNQDARHNLVDLKDDISSNPDIVSFIEDYLQHNDETIRFFVAMKESLGLAQETADRTFSDVLRCFNVADYQGTLQKLRELKEAENSFTNKFIEELQSVHDRHALVLKNLSQKKKMLDEKMGPSPEWKKVWAIVVPAVSATSAICDFLLTALTVPPVAIAAVAASFMSIGTIKLWIDWLWDNYNKALKRKKKVISLAEKATSHAINELNSVSVVATDLEARISGIVETDQFAVNKEVEVEAAVKVGMEDMSKKINAFKKSAKELEKNVEWCIREIRKNKQDIFDGAELGSYYEETCPLDPKLNSFSIALRQHTTNAISSVAEDAAINRPLSCRSLKRATDGIRSVNHDARDNLVDLKDAISSNSDLFSLVQDYLQHSEQTISFLEKMKESLVLARKTVRNTFSDAVRCFNVADYQGTLQKLKELMEVEKSFTKNLVKKLQAVLKRYESVRANLSRKKKMLDEKLGPSREWKKVWAIVVPAVCATVAICSLLLTALTVPPVAISAVAVSVTLIATNKLWIDWLWDNNNKTFKRQKKVISKAENATGCAIDELTTVRVLATNLEAIITGTDGTAQFAINEVKEVEAAVNVTLEDMRKKIKTFKKSAKKLEKSVDRCIREIRKDKRDILDKITTYSET